MHGRKLLSTSLAILLSTSNVQKYVYVTTHIKEILNYFRIIRNYNYSSGSAEPSGSDLSAALSMTPRLNACATCASLPTAIAIELALQ